MQEDRSMQELIRVLWLCSDPFISALAKRANGFLDDASNASLWR